VVSEGRKRVAVDPMELLHGSDSVQARGRAGLYILNTLEAKKMGALCESGMRNKEIRRNGHMFNGRMWRERIFKTQI
jgi:hypothetical protein